MKKILSALGYLLLILALPVYVVSQTPQTGAPIGWYLQGTAATDTDRLFPSGCVVVSTPAVATGVVAGDRARLTCDENNNLFVNLATALSATTDSFLTYGSSDGGTTKHPIKTSTTGVVKVDTDAGASVHYRTSAGATEDEHEIKATAGRLFSVTVTNTNAAARYLRCYNLTAANTTPGTSTVFLGFAIPGATAGAGATTNFGPKGIAFSTALTCAFTTGAADTDVAEVAANEIKAVYVYE